MSLFKYIDRVKTIHKLIEAERTGTSEELARVAKLWCPLCVIVLVFWLEFLALINSNGSPSTRNRIRMLCSYYSSPLRCRFCYGFCSAHLLPVIADKNT